MSFQLISVSGRQGEDQTKLVSKEMQGTKGEAGVIRVLTGYCHYHIESSQSGRLSAPHSLFCESRKDCRAAEVRYCTVSLAKRWEVGSCGHGANARENALRGSFQQRTNDNKRTKKTDDHDQDCDMQTRARVRGFK